jgi:hypothetical protein
MRRCSQETALLETADYAEVVTVVGTVEPEERGR